MSPDKLVSLLDRGTRPGVFGACVQHAGATHTARQVRAAVTRRARRLLDHGVAAGDRVLLVCDHDLDAVVTLAAASALGLRVLMPYNLAAAAVPEWRSIATAAGPDAVVHQRRDGVGLADLRAVCPRLVGLSDLGALSDLDAPSGHDEDDEDDETLPIACPDPVDGFLVLFTSGTTGAPKAISLSEDVVARRVMAVTERLAFGSDARVFMSGLLNNTTGVIFSFGALAHGATLIIPDGRDVSTWPAQVARSRASHIMLRPVAMERFVAAVVAGGTDLSCLRVVAYGAAPMPHRLLELGRRLMPCDWVQGYGLSETYGPFCWLDETAHRQRRFEDTYCVGRPDRTVGVRLEPLPGHPDGVGEIVVRGDLMMDGYLDITTGRLDPPGPWLRTGDMGAFGPDGDLLLKGRIGTSVLSQDGHRIYPEEVETVLAGMPGVGEVVVVGLSGGGENDHTRTPVACLWGPVTHDGPAALRRATAEFLIPRLSREKWPDLIYASADPFPKSGNDKILRAETERAIDRQALFPL
ncbi:Acyl-CoA synthetase (AMP-forming)/AMP-acid ligase II [Parafrankia irregularis]|uniref:Acyl-CoA synthetase (AMP-forming)/AMP-acid ligase II n=1 Tax=Parafrankia irregularis TaxID=795642 RepID=A0A0S4QW40_9ACTN|nr:MULTISPECIES: long-chain fatty acid--CoA ligase [Parafrankia]MBE3201582.1 AMP-binding protein [Parafrankia sp. CH37]CUU59343.1 Acyl-CoA synthetase (AMP-forming)/AMP-acid ligase II [Parafrankia irregularis]